MIMAKKETAPKTPTAPKTEAPKPPVEETKEPKAPETTTAPVAPVEPVAPAQPKKKAKEFVFVKVLSSISVEGSTIRTGEIVKIKAETAKSFGPRYIEIVAEPKETETQE